MKLQCYAIDQYFNKKNVDTIRQRNLPYCPENQLKQYI